MNSTIVLHYEEKLVYIYFFHFDKHIIVFIRVRICNYQLIVIVTTFQNQILLL